MATIKRALISVSDKSGILELAIVLTKLNVEILSTGGTAKLFRDNNIPVIEVSDYTGFTEMLDGRVKTLHPKAVSYTHLDVYKRQVLHCAFYQQPHSWHAKWQACWRALHSTFR